MNQSKNLKLSIITAIYNNANVIELAIKSVLSQTYPNIEHIIVDGASTDGTLAVLDQYHDRVSKVISEPDLGIYDALNKGIKASTGDVIGFLHSDDEFNSPTSVANLMNALSESGADGIYSDLQYVRRAGGDNHLIRMWKSRPFQPKLLSRGWMPAHPTLLLKREVYKKIGFYNLDYRIASDYDFILRVFKSPNYRFHYLPEVTVSMQIGGESNKSLSKIIQKSKEDYRILTKQGFSPAITLFAKNFSKLGQFFYKRSKRGTQ
jgi:glycosyltransferase involved in cell wall biosynthesis